ncbi:hypothetical protein BZL35_00321 [Candidatus Pandoraea novymonadis]|uniref:Uncharacterized protein n=1 Tax=Candidatus Pandoraea novymonadis TaxID=1808959 RepID=A0ABX5FEG0_9BURK|nr:hypothetical protein BZL35_00321 [Candidatus Pandoraea novymonadis]
MHFQRNHYKKYQLLTDNDLKFFDIRTRISYGGKQAYFIGEKPIAPLGENKKGTFPLGRNLFSKFGWIIKQKNLITTQLPWPACS